MRAAQRAFTLLEVLVSLTLLGLLLVLVAGALTTSRHTLESSERYSVRLTDVRAAQRYLRASLQQAVPLSLGSAERANGIVFRGNSQQLSYLGPMPGPLGGGLRVQTLSLPPAQGGASASPLQVSFAPLGAATALPSVPSQVVLPEVKALRFRYRGIDAAGQATPWLPDWPWPTRLPSAVSVQLDIDGPVRWVPMIIDLPMSQGVLAAEAR
ncbi:MAG: hypothetical protein GAK43_02546 [Stenotrophomonas maltophilia]|nr:MAG: hypothetical protein GAK43_02546 [Stenotrophomonas maltophilia]